MLTMERELLLEHMARVTSLMDLYERGDASFVEHSMHWLREMEKLLQRFRSPEVSLLATLRGRIMAARDGYREPEIDDKVSNRKMVRATVADCIAKADEAIRKRLHAINCELDGMSAKMYQLIALASAVRPINVTPKGNRETWLFTIWQGLGVDGPTNQLKGYLSASLALGDRLYLLDDIMRRFMEALPAALEETSHHG